MLCCVLTVREVLWPTPPKISSIWMPPSCGARPTHRANQTRSIFSGNLLLFFGVFFPCISVVGAFFSFLFLTLCLFFGVVVCYCLCSVILHEMGHVLGLGHSKNPEDVMSPWYNASLKALTQNDIDRARQNCKTPFNLGGGGGKSEEKN